MAICSKERAQYCYLTEALEYARTLPSYTDEVESDFIERLDRLWKLLTADEQHLVEEWLMRRHG